MAAIFELKTGDTKAALEYELSDYAAGSSLLDGATVLFSLKGADGIVLDEAPGVIRDADGVVAYEWAEGDTDTAGFYDFEFAIVFPDGKRLTYPSGDNYEFVHIGQSI